MPDTRSTTRRREEEATSGRASPRGKGANDDDLQVIIFRGYSVCLVRSGRAVDDFFFLAKSRKQRSNLIGEIQF